MLTILQPATKSSLQNTHWIIPHPSGKPSSLEDNLNCFLRAIQPPPIPTPTTPALPASCLSACKQGFPLHLTCLSLQSGALQSGHFLPLPNFSRPPTHVSKMTADAPEFTPSCHRRRHLFWEFPQVLRPTFSSHWLWVGGKRFPVSTTGAREGRLTGWFWSGAWSYS